MKFKRAITTISCLPALFFLFCSTGFADEVFSTPDNLKDNLAFWKKIYTEVSLKEGIIHNSEYPLIIYKEITIGTRKGRTRRNFIRKHIGEVKGWLTHIDKRAESQWTAKEQEIAQLFRQYASIEKVKSAKSRVRFQQGQKERFKKGLERSGAYMPYIRSVFQKYKIPGRIAYLPHVESSFNIAAYSRVGAAGMWQFMRGTGKLFLKVGYRIDERRDPFKSTVAAAKLLRKNYEKLKSWPLAITAYNHGLVSINRAVKVTGSRDLGIIIEKYKNRRFKFASKNFYGCFLAASEIAANPDKYFSNIAYHSPWQYNEIRLKNYLRPKTLSKHLGLSQGQLKKLNPALRPIVFKRQLPIPRGFRLRIPAALSTQAAIEKLAAVQGAVKKATPGGQFYYTVERGDTLYAISRRFRVSTESLIIANEIPRENRIYIGQVLRIPGKGGPNKDKEKEKEKTETAKKITAAPIEPKPQEKPEPQKVDPALEKPAGNKTAEAFDATLYNLDVNAIPSNRQAVVTVSVNETLGHYADWLNTATWRIRRLNRGRRTIRVNQKIRVPLKHQLQSLELFKKRRLEYHMALEEDFYSQYRVVDIKQRKVSYGDNLWSICIRDEEIPIWLFKKYNRDIDIDPLKINMKLRIPVIAAKANGNNRNNGKNGNN